MLIFIIVLGSSLIITPLLALIAIPFTGLDEFNNLLNGIASTSYLRYLQMVQGFSVFIIPSLIAAWVLSKKPWKWLKFRKINVITILLSLALFIICQPLVSHLAILNKSLALPEFMLPLEVWMRNTEDSAGKLVFQFLETNDPLTILFNVTIVVLLPSFGEELLFRGAIQPTIGLWAKNQHLAVWVTALLFSAMHIQFFSFLPRFLLGGMLGYLLVYGKSIWYPIAGHFSNNLLSLLIFYYYRRYKPEINPMDADASAFNNWIVIGSVIGIVSIFLFIQNRTKSMIASEEMNVAD